LQPQGAHTSRVILTVAGIAALAFFCLGIPLAIIVPVIRNSAHSGRHAFCLNNMRNLGLAVASYETARKTYPGYRDILTINTAVPVNGVQTNQAPVNWFILVLPSLERPDLYRHWKNLTAVNFSADGQETYTFPAVNGVSVSPVVYMELPVCPDDPQTPRPVRQGQPISYVVNAGLQDVPATATTPGDWPANGVFVSRWEMPTANGPQLFIAQSDADSVRLGDGLSQTLLLSESKGARNYDDVFVNVGGPGSLQKPVSEQWNCFVWQPQYPLPANLSQVRINGRPSSGVDPSPDLAANISYARPSSNHAGVTNVLFCDTHVRFISENIG
jgi:prepilin-type processing-associated H-X9-DG protein